MTGNELSSNLGLRLEDPAESVFTKQAKVDAINLAQKTVVNMVDSGYLTELEQISGSNSTGSDGTKSFSGAGIDPVRGSISGIYSQTASKWCTMIESKDVKRLENSYLAGSASNPVAYIFNETIYVKPEQVSVIDIWYLASPTDFVYSDSGSGTGGMASACVLNPALYELVLDFAESQLWRMDAKSDRATSAYNNALNLVKVLNERYQVEKPEGIGTKGR
tara:strand:+ start:7405 stop:8064 length:660 start_codon:yes stop_codon:yes gene_type:complete